MEIRLFVMEDGRCPFEDWVDQLRDRGARGRILARLNRVRLGNFGDAKALGEGLWELRFGFGPGYRVYFGREGQQAVILLCGGAKSSQRRDIMLARAYWETFKERHE